MKDKAPSWTGQRPASSRMEVGGRLGVVEGIDEERWRHYAADPPTTLGLFAGQRAGGVRCDHEDNLRFRLCQGRLPGRRD